MRKGRILGKIFGIVLVCLVTGSMLNWMPRNVVQADSPECGSERDVCQCGKDNPYDCCDNDGNDSMTDICDGNCVWFAWEMACCNWGVGLPSWGNAGNWAERAEQDGFPVSYAPAIGTIACRERGDFGHVAWVINVSTDKAEITVLEMNCCEAVPSWCNCSGEPNESYNCVSCGEDNPNCPDFGASVRSCNYPADFFDRYIYPLYAGGSNTGVVYSYAGDKDWEAISPTCESPPEDIVSESISIESPHPYPNNYNNTWTEVRLGAAAIRVHFSYIQTESYCDHVYIRDSDGNIINDYSGYYADVWSSWVFGNTIKIQLTSDYSVVREGFVIDRLEWSTTQPQMPLGYAVLCLVDYDGQLYAGTMSTSDPSSGVGRVYRYDGGTSWTLVGDNLDNQVSSLAVYQGNLYAGTAWNGMRLYKYTPGETNCDIANWTRVVDYADWDGTRSLCVSHDYLLMGDIVWDYIGHWDGSTFYQDQTEMTGSCIYDFEDYGDKIYAAAYEGRMWQSSDIINWDVVLDYYEPDYPNIWELETFQGLLYMAYNNGELRATDGTDLRGTLKYTAPDGIISMETDGVNLYFGTGGEAGAYYGSETEGIANIYEYDGSEVTLISHEDEFGAGVQVLYISGVITPDITPPTCVIEPRKDGIEIDEIDVGQFFDIYVGDSSDNIGIREVRFSSDESQDGIATGEWTEWHGWNTSSGDWSADTKIKKWSFATGGNKEGWAELRDFGGNTAQCHANIFAHPGYAIIVAGETKWPLIHIDKRHFDHAAKNAYRALHNLGFDDDDIFYLNSNEQPDVEVDDDASFGNFVMRINEVQDKIGDDPTPFVLYLVGHGGRGPDRFVFDFDVGGAEDYLTVPMLKGFLDLFSSQTPMLIVINSCDSGCFITSDEEGPDTISAVNRIIITAARCGEDKLVQVLARQSDRFWGKLNEGLSVEAAFTSTFACLSDEGNLAQSMRIGIPQEEQTPLDYLLLANLFSPGELRIYDSSNRVTGLVEGEVKEEIPGSVYDQDNNIVTVFSPLDTYRYQVVGTDEETYGLDIASIEEGEATTFAATDIPTTSGAVHEYTINWDVLSEGEEGITIKIDSDGDGEFEEIIFTSQPNTPSNPSPLNDAANVSAETDLSWTGGDPDAGDIVTYDVYFGSSSIPPLKETIGPYAGDQTSITHDPGTLNYNTTYYWKIVARDNHAIVKEGPLWDFTTELGEWDPWSYDEDDSGFIEISELLDTINDYIGGDITISQLLEIISLYISHTPKP